jgi:hypothetical protein
MGEGQIPLAAPVVCVWIERGGRPEVPKANPAHSCEGTGTIVGCNTMMSGYSSGRPRTTKTFPAKILVLS